MTALATLTDALSLADLVPGLDTTAARIVPVDITLDSREVRQGSLFLALPGTAGDGRAYIEAALAAGAGAVLAEAEGLQRIDNSRVFALSGLRELVPGLARRFFADPSAHMGLVAVTGTNGKTSVADFVSQLLRQIGVAAGSIGTLGARTGGPALAARNTTPDIVTLNRQLAAWLQVGVDHVALEASSHALDQQRLAGLSMHTAIFTNISRDHFDYHGDEESYVRAKLRLFSEFALKRAIFNADDPQASRAREVANCPAMGISLESAEADVFVQVLDLAGGLRLRMHTPWGTRELFAPLSGTFNAFNVVAAVMAVVGMGYPLGDVIDAAERLAPVPGRMQTIDNDLGFRVLLDYAHTPDALSRALTAVKPQTTGQLWVVFGCGGDRDPGKRAEMGAIAGQLADRVVVTSDNPRSEDPASITDDVVAGIRGDHLLVLDRAQAIATAIQGAAPGDTVLIAGKGHEDYQEVAGQRLPFSDRDHAVAQLSSRGGHD